MCSLYTKANISWVNLYFVNYPCSTWVCRNTYTLTLSRCHVNYNHSALIISYKQDHVRDNSYPEIISKTNGQHAQFMSSHVWADSLKFDIYNDHKQWSLANKWSLAGKIRLSETRPREWIRFKVDLMMANLFSVRNVQFVYLNIPKTTKRQTFIEIFHLNMETFTAICKQIWNSG